MVLPLNQRGRLGAKVENIKKLMHTNVAGKDYGPVSFATRGNRLLVLRQHQIIFTAGSSGRAVVRLPLAKEADPISPALSQDERNAVCGQSAARLALRSAVALTSAGAFMQSGLFHAACERSLSSL